MAIGSVLRENGHYPEAAARLERAVAQRARLDSTSREYADALRELGNVYGVAGPMERADSLFRRALPIVRERFGSRHPDVAFLLANLGNTASQRGRLVEAEAYQREAASITAEWYGPGHYLTAAVNGVLAQTLNRLKRYDEAVALMRQSITAFERSADLGPNAAVTYIAHGTLAVALSGKGDYAAASHEYATALEGLRKTRGENNTNTLTVAGNLATSILHEGHADSSVKLLRGILTRATGALGESHVVVANTRVKLGESLLAAGHPAEAIPLETAGLHVIDSAVSRRAPLALVGRETLLAAYLAVGDSANATKLRREMADTARPPGKR
jgi:tetratricopeptide (TPR) repeat protein